MTKYTKILYNKNDRFDLDEIRMTLSYEEFKEYKKIFKKILKIQEEIYEAEMNNDIETLQNLKDQLKTVKRREIIFRNETGITRMELNNKIFEINKSIAKGEKIILPKRYKKILNTFKTIVCPNCGTLRFIEEDNNFIMCFKCGKVLSKDKE